MPRTKSIPKRHQNTDETAENYWLNKAERNDLGWVHLGDGPEGIILMNMASRFNHPSGEGAVGRRVDEGETSNNTRQAVDTRPQKIFKEKETEIDDKQLFQSCFLKTYGSTSSWQPLEVLSDVGQELNSNNASGQHAIPGGSLPLTRHYLSPQEISTDSGTDLNPILVKLQEKKQKCPNLVDVRASKVKEREMAEGTSSGEEEMHNALNFIILGTGDYQCPLCPCHSDKIEIMKKSCKMVPHNVSL